MNIYAEQITGINDTIARLPKVNARIQRHFGEKRQQAGMDFLGRIHNEITAAHPNWRKDDELSQPNQRIGAPKAADIKAEAPALTDDYLQRLGIPTTLASMSSKPELGLEVLGGKPGEHDEEEAA